MLAITIKQPWAHLIAAGTKRIENRSWGTRHRGPLLIHAGRSTTPPDEATMDELERHGVRIPYGDEMTYGAIIAVVNVVDCIAWDNLPPHLREDPFASGPFCWILEDAQPVEPIQIGGKLGLWQGPDLVEVE